VVCTAFETLVARTEAQPNMTPEAARRLGFEIAQPNHN